MNLIKLVKQGLYVAAEDFYEYDRWILNLYLLSSLDYLAIRLLSTLHSQFKSDKQVIFKSTKNVSIIKEMIMPILSCK